MTDGLDRLSTIACCRFTVAPLERAVVTAANASSKTVGSFHVSQWELLFNYTAR